MSTTTDDELLALCDTATPGRWHVNPHDEIEVRTETRDARGGYYQTVCETYNATTAAFIAAASPDRVKALVMRVRELEAWIANPPKDEDR